jgi:y4mF family transcriptional regulator
LPDPGNSTDFIQSFLRAFSNSEPTAVFAIATITDLAPLIRDARKRMGMNQQTFANYAGVGRRFLSELENGKSSLEFDKVLACAWAAGIDIFARRRRSI